jgi:D-alanyl-D-alanine carboxypeptidase
VQGPLRSWHPGCPVAKSALRVVTVSYWGFDGAAHDGRLIVARTAVTPVVTVMRKLYAARFPIRRIVPIDAYGADDDRSMSADNTSAFNCRRVEGSTSWSQHAYGTAIDVNPLENPSVHVDGRVSPRRGRRFANRSLHRKGMIHEGDVVVRAFATVGWQWGGRWHEPRDYQHFFAR